MNKGKLYLVGLPVGNWEDMPPRALKYIKNAKNIVIEREEAFEKIWPALGLPCFLLFLFILPDEC